MFIDMTVKSARANDAASRRLAADARRSPYGKAVRIHRDMKDARSQVIELANRGWLYDDYLGTFVPEPYLLKEVAQ